MKIRNKIFPAIAACILLLSAGCKGDPVKEAIGILDDATVKVEQCQSEEDAVKITEETGEKLKELGLKNDELTPEQQRHLTDALVKYMQACMKQRLKSDGSTNAQPVIEMNPDTAVSGK